jgi:hypothetical protein
MFNTPKELQWLSSLKYVQKHFKCTRTECAHHQWHDKWLGSIKVFPIFAVCVLHLLHLRFSCITLQVGMVLVVWRRDPWNLKDRSWDVTSLETLVAKVLVPYNPSDIWVATIPVILSQRSENRALPNFAGWVTRRKIVTVSVYFPSTWWLKYSQMATIPTLSSSERPCTSWILQGLKLTLWWMTVQVMFHEVHSSGLTLVFGCLKFELTLLWNDLLFLHFLVASQCSYLGRCSLSSHSCHTSVLRLWFLSDLWDQCLAAVTDFGSWNQGTHSTFCCCSTILHLGL